MHIQEERKEGTEGRNRNYPFTCKVSDQEDGLRSLYVNQSLTEPQRLHEIQLSLRIAVQSKEDYIYITPKKTKKNKKQKQKKRNSKSSDWKRFCCKQIIRCTYRREGREGEID